VYRPNDAVDLATASDSGGGYLVGWTQAGEWLKYTVNVTTSGVYQLQTRVANIGTGATFRLEVDGVDQTGPIAVPDTGGWQTWQTLTTSGISLSAGQHVLRVVFLSMTSRSAAGNFNWFRLDTASQSTPYTGTPTPIPGVIEAENFDKGGQNLAYSDTTSTNLGGAYRPNEAVDLTTASDTGGGYLVGWTQAGEWLNYTVNVTSSGVYQLQTRVANIGTGATFRLEVDGVDQTGPIAVPDTGGWQTWQTLTTSGISLSAGQHVLRVVFLSMTSRSAAGNFNWFKIQ
jgi:hypothetical protein